MWYQYSKIYITGNHRPVSVMLSLCKILEEIVRDHVQKNASENGNSERAGMAAF